MSKGITVTKQQDMAEWYTQVVQKADLADYATVKGCFILKPQGYAIWQAIQDYFNVHIVKATGVKNAYFPLFIPESFFHKEAQHAQGFSPEVAWIDASLTGDGERLAIRPTSETVMYDTFSQWIRSYRDLPLKINQWANIVRWETKATKLFMRSREFLWQEGHCVYETQQECEQETERYIHLYAKLCEELLAMPVIVGKKTDAERFAGAVHTYTIEAFLPDGKALQAGTSHHLGQGFAKAFGISYTGKDKQQHIPWQNSWGISTRLIGGLVMTHADDKGMVLPPSVTEQKIVIIPVYTKEDKEVVDTHVQQLAQQLPNVIVDDSEEYSFGHKCKEWELKGIPLRVEIGPKDIAQQQVILVRRDTHEKITCPLSQVAQQTATLLKTIQQDLYTQAKQRMEALIVEVTSKEAFMKNAPNNMFICAPFCGEASVEEAIKQETGLGSRCFDMHKHITHEKCFYSGKPAIGWCYFSRSY